MIPFPGESAFLATTQNLAGTIDPNIMALIRYRAGSCTIDAGDVFVGGFYAYDYLEAGADAVFSVVLVIESGSGTLRLSGGPDPTFPLDGTTSSANPLGDHVVSGAGELVVDMPWLTVADYLVQTGYSAVRVECLSGSVEIGQMKLRIWPPGGPLGGWADGAAWDEAGAASGVRGGSGTEFVANTGSQPNASVFAYLRDTALPAARSTYEGPQTFHLGLDGFLSSEAEATIGVTPDGVDHTAIGVNETPSLVVWFGSDPLTYNPIPSTLVDGVDYVRPPDEVDGDVAYYAQTDTPATFEWVGAPSVDTYATMTGGSAVPLDLAGLSVSAWAGDIPAGILDNFDNYFDLSVSVLHGPATLTVGSVGTSTGTYSLPTGGPAIFALLTFSGVLDPPEPTGNVGYLLGMLVEALDGYIAHPDFRYWSPSGAAQHPLRLIQRGDSLGMGSGRILGAGTRQGSLKVFGSL